jgi:predicted transcriptional regulator
MILQTIKKTAMKYVAIAGVVALLGLGAYAGYLKLQNGKQDTKIKQMESALSTAVQANKSLDEEIKQMKKDKALNDKLMLEREQENAELEEVYEKIEAKLNAVQQDASWNRTVLVPCTVTRSLFDDPELGCREQTQ